MTDKPAMEPINLDHLPAHYRKKLIKAIKKEKLLNLQRKAIQGKQRND